MSNEKQFSQDLLEQILNLVESVINRMAEVGSADDLVLTEQGKLLLDAVCMQYLALGELERDNGFSGRTCTSIF